MGIRGLAERNKDPPTNQIIETKDKFNQLYRNIKKNKVDLENEIMII